MDDYTSERLRSRIKEIIGELIVTGEIKNHNLSSLSSVTNVELSKDGAYAKVYISSLGDNSTLDKSVKALTQSSSFIQRRIAKVLKTRNTPVLTFIKDTSYIEGERINKLIDEALSGSKSE